MVSAAASISIYPAPSIRQLHASSNAIDIGQPVILQANVSGGTGSFQYGWFEKRPGSSAFSVIEGENAATYTFVPENQTGIWSIGLALTDTGTTTPFATNLTLLAVEVNPLPTVTISVINPSSTEPSFTANVSGGTAPFSYEWSVNGKHSGGNFSNFTPEYNASMPGNTLLIGVKVADSGSSKESPVTASQEVRQRIPLQSAQLGSLPEWAVIAVFASIVAIIGILLTYAAIRHRKSAVGR